MFDFIKRLLTKSTISQEVLTHSSKGDYTASNRPRAGGHGQESINYMKTHNIQYNIVDTCKNGVRFGNIPSHKEKRRTTGNFHSWFPKSWSRATIKKAGEKVLNLFPNKLRNNTNIIGCYKNVKVVVKKHNGSAVTIFPHHKQIRRKKR